jgi:hypothetical protein
MPLTPFTIERFGGLDLVSDPLDIGANGSVDMLNVDLARHGMVRSRAGLTPYSVFDQGTPASNNFTNIHQAHDGSVLAQADKLYAIDENNGTEITNTALYTAAGPYANFGTAASSKTYIGRLAATPVTWDGAAFAAPAFTGTQPVGTGLAVTPYSNRLANWGITGNPFRVIFSDAGDPLTFTASNFVDLVTNDSTALTGHLGLVWSDKLFLLTQRYCHVFYGESPDADGLPVFNYRTIATPFAAAYRSHMVAAADGVYVMTTQGLYKTIGGDFALVSDAVSPLVQRDASIGSAPALYLLGNSVGFRALAVEDRIYFPCSNAAPPGQVPTHMLVWDIRAQSWLVWSMAFTSLGWMSRQEKPRLLVSLRTGTTPNRIMYLDPAATTDNGTTISCSYKSGKYPLADPGRVAITNASSLVGYGTVTLRVDSDLYSNQSASATLGTAPAFAEGWPAPVDQEGHWLQHTLSWTGAGAVTRLTHFVSSVKPAGVV